MMHNEFEKLSGKSVTPDEYNLIEFIYQWHPSISDNNGKEQIISLYSIGGLRLIRDMKPVAELNHQIQKEIDEAKNRMNFFKNQRELLTSGADINFIESNIKVLDEPLELELMPL